jgi:hypothetical protein
VQSTGGKLSSNVLAGYPLLSRSPKTLRREPSQPSAVQVERCWRLPQIHARKPPQHGRVVQRLFGPGERGPADGPRPHAAHSLSAVAVQPQRSCGRISASNSAYGTTRSISSRNSSRRVFFPYLSNPLCAARLCCLTRLPPPRPRLIAWAVDRRVLQRFLSACSTSACGRPRAAAISWGCGSRADSPD